ncbi:hypothetical protein BCL76_102427 [Streptomyces sp. CG 926]|uniref:hypothetical protein n=1 Tax=Streptomyces sp. CG 926 TaxID=1882405 RepID=UPI000D6B9576|nr:hypothetical protein [Streptomyces sp. CG 926]PWK73402.1 hypothetical protein BCL76_102427 [Streptomyces sp. CG 926]
MNHSLPHAGAPHERDLPPYQVVLAETDWRSLQTAFGSGEDLPGVLARLLEPDAKVQVSALSELGELVGHQNTLYEATAPVAMYVAGILTHPAAMTLRPYRDVPIRATLLNWLAYTAYDASDEIVGRTEQYFPGFLTPGSIVAAFRDLRPMLYRAAVPFLRDSHEDVREAAVVAALVLAEHPVLAEHRDDLAVHARALLDAGGDDPNRRVARKALEAWGHDVPDSEPVQEGLWDRGPHSDGRGDLEAPF